MFGDIRKHAQRQTSKPGHTDRHRSVEPGRRERLAAVEVASLGRHERLKSKRDRHRPQVARFSGERQASSKSISVVT